LMNYYEKFVGVKKYTDSIAPIYGTEDFSVHLYSVIKMMRPKTVVELGTGLGSAMLWSGLALEENGEGKIYTVDDGSEWYRLKTAREALGAHYREEYEDFIVSLIRKYKLGSQIEFLHERINIVEKNNIDILFSDFAHGTFDVTKILVDYLPRMSEYSKIYIDSASTHYPSYMALNRIIDILNSGKIPRTFYDIANIDVKQFLEKVQSSEFKIEHIVENKDRNQNSTCCITIQPIDIFPYPRVNIRSV